MGRIASVAIVGGGPTGAALGTCVGEYVREEPIGKLLNFHFEKHLPRIFTGEKATHPYSLALIRFMVSHGLAGNDPDELRVL